MAKQMMKLTVEEVGRTSRTTSSAWFATAALGQRSPPQGMAGRLQRIGREAAGRLFRMAHNWTVGRGVPDTVQMSRKTFHLWQKLGDFCASI